MLYFSTIVLHNLYCLWIIFWFWFLLYFLLICLHKCFFIINGKIILFTNIKELRHIYNTFLINDNIKSDTSKIIHYLFHILNESFFVNTQIILGRCNYTYTQYLPLHTEVTQFPFVHLKYWVPSFFHGWWILPKTVVLYYKICYF